MNLKLFEGALLPGLIFFFFPEAALDIADVAECSCLDGNGHLHQEGEDQEPRCPNAEGDHELQGIRKILNNLAQRIRDKSGDDKARPFFNPDSYDHE